MLGKSVWDQGSSLKDKDRSEVLQFSWKWGLSSINLENKKIIFFSYFPSSLLSRCLPPHRGSSPLFSLITGWKSKLRDMGLSSVPGPSDQDWMPSGNSLCGCGCAGQRLGGRGIGISPLFCSLPPTPTIKHIDQVMPLLERNKNV